MEDQENHTKRRLEDGPLLKGLLHNKQTEDKDSESPVLSNLVRNTYFQYIKQVLTDNGEHTHVCISKDNIKKLAQNIELNALKMCMSTIVYRYVMLTEINNIKCMTHSNVPFTEKKALNTEETVMAAESLNIFLKTYEKHSRDSNLVSLITNRDYSQNMRKPNESNIKQSTSSPEPMAVDNNESTPPFIAGQTTFTNTDSGVNAQDGQKETVYEKLFNELKEIFGPDENNSAAGGQNVGNIQTSPTTVISGDLYFAHGNRNFWYLEYEINKGLYHKKASKMHALNKLKYNKVEDMSMVFGQETSEVSTSPAISNQMTYICKDRIAWHVNNCLSVYYRKKRFRSTDEFRILVKNVVPRLMKINPYMEFNYIYKAINKLFDEKKTHVQNINDIQIIVAKIEKTVSGMIHNNPPFIQ